MISAALKDDHTRIMESMAQLISSLRNGKNSGREMVELKEALRLHIFIDETQLFRMAENSSNRTRIRGLEIEHAGMLQLHDKIGDYESKNARFRALDRAEGHARVLEVHNNRESENVYSALDVMDMNHELVAHEIEIAEVPQGWVCKFLQR